MAKPACRNLQTTCNTNRNGSWMVFPFKLADPMLTFPPPILYITPIVPTWYAHSYAYFRLTYRVLLRLCGDFYDTLSTTEGVRVSFYVKVSVVNLSLVVNLTLSLGVGGSDLSSGPLRSFWCTIISQDLIQAYKLLIRYCMQYRCTKLMDRIEPPVSCQA